MTESLHALAEPMSWRLVTELWRRHPRQFQLIETHPCSGQYDCLSLFGYEDGEQHVLDVNRGGSIHVHTGARPGSWQDWLERMLVEPKPLLDEVEAAIGLQAPVKLPASTPATLTFRFIAELLTHSIGRLETWECRNGLFDTSGYGGGSHKTWFEQFPGINSTLLTRLPGACHFDAACGYWFIVKDGNPLLCLDVAGKLYNTDGETHDLFNSYRHKRRIWKLIADYAIELLP